jgi:hypothetical protein
MLPDTGLLLCRLAALLGCRSGLRLLLPLVKGLLPGCLFFPAFYLPLDVVHLV